MKSNHAMRGIIVRSLFFDWSSVLRIHLYIFKFLLQYIRNIIKNNLCVYYENIQIIVQYEDLPLTLQHVAMDI